MRSKFKKSDLRTGMVVETVGGIRYIVFLDMDLSVSQGSVSQGCKDNYLLSKSEWMCLSNYDENLKFARHDHGDKFDIVKVSSFAVYSGINGLLSLAYSLPIFDKNRPIVMTIKEIEEALGYKVAVNIGNVTYCDDTGE